MSVIENGNSLISFEVLNEQETDQGYIVSIKLSDSDPPSNGDTSCLLIQLPLEPNPLKTNYAFLDGDEIPIPNKLGEFDTTIPKGANKYEISICGQSIVIIRVGEEVSHMFVDDPLVVNYNVIDISGPGVSNIEVQNKTKCSTIEESSSEEKPSGLKPGEIAAIVISSLVFACIVGVIIWSVHRYVKGKRLNGKQNNVQRLINS